LDPETTKSGAREQALLDVYRYQVGASSTIATVLRTDPSTDVKSVAIDVFRLRWKAGTDPSGAQSGTSWCAKSASTGALKSKCLKLLGDLGDAKAGAVIGSQIGSDDKEVRDGAGSACKKWMDRFPNGNCA
ncbi:MAG: hypothetical protein ABMB14_40020, partial [Myxococcota bacterium]